MKPRGDVTRNPKQGYHWLHKRTIGHQKYKFPALIVGSAVPASAAAVPDAERLYPPGQDVHPGAGGGRRPGHLAHGRAGRAQGRTLQVQGHRVGAASPRTTGPIRSRPPSTHSPCKCISYIHSTDESLFMNNHIPPLKTCPASEPKLCRFRSNSNTNSLDALVCNSRGFVTI